MIVVSGVDHDLIAQSGITARQPTHHVGGANLRQGVLKRQRGRHAQRHRLEIAALRQFDEFRKIPTRDSNELDRRVFGDPRRDLETRLVLCRQFELLARPRGLHDLPRITRRRDRVNDDRADRAPLSRRRVLVIPSTVVEPGVSGEQLGIPIRVVVHDQQDFAAQVLSLEIIPRVLGCVDSVADEDDFCSVDFRECTLYAARCDELVPVLERERLRTALERPASGYFCSDADDVELL